MFFDDLFITLLGRKYTLDAWPAQVSSDHNGLQKAYCLLHTRTEDLPKPRQTRYTHLKAREIYGKIYLISKTLFVLVATSVSTSKLVSFRADEIIPFLEQWWKQYPPSDSFVCHADALLHALEGRRRRGELVPRVKKKQNLSKPKES
ncbi:hypothetical protein VTN49DRAFT_2192 [Thermomyces lanuginosus]|uniref:uncharacterized protein n=1 Tax=Thermomyces lanuginosus TaxID=5541 RepID=UPI0037447593